MSGRVFEPWGRLPQARQQGVAMYWRNALLPEKTRGAGGFLAYGNGRSYGDVCLNQAGVLLDMAGLDRLISFDADSGVLCCEAGITLGRILEFTVPRGWFLPVSPGTQFATLGGAVANDVHGKNHHVAGTFGCHVRRFELLRSDGARLRCSPGENPDLYAATIGGLGLTGVITWAEIQLRPVTCPDFDQESIRFGCLDEFFSLAAESDAAYEYTVAWIDCSATGASLGRGLFLRGNHAEAEQVKSAPRAGGPARLTMPIDPPVSLVNRVSLRAFNTLYYRKQLPDRCASQTNYRKFLYPLDGVLHWNRMYGANGFFQYQCVLPRESMHDASHELLGRVTRVGAGSFLTVLKLFGERQSPGLLSFPMPGATLTLDFANAGERTLALLDCLDEVTVAAGGRINPSKDARMSGRHFRDAFPNWERLLALKDPNVCSDFWRRVTEDT